MWNDRQRSALACVALGLTLCVATGSRCAEAESDAPAAGLKKAIFKVRLTDPVFPSTPARSYDVVQARDPREFPVEYSLSFETEVCTDGQCQPVSVTMVWNPAGAFKRLEHPSDKPLMKKDDVLFTDDDYAKLNGILKDRNSILSGWTLDFLEQPEEPAADVDAVSGPTPIEVEQSVIEDAAYSTWALWHWANGEIVPKLRGITRQSCSPAYLNHLLASEDQTCLDFAMDDVMKRHPSDPQFVDSVSRILETGERYQITRALEYLNRAIPDKLRLHARLIDSCRRMRPTDCPMILRQLAAEPELPAATFEGLTGLFPQLPYFPIHLILRILEDHKFASEKTLSDVAALLDGDDFFIARRAYQYLAKQNLEGALRKKVDAFGDQNRDRL